jgi:beta-phosphoglucomutase-like phosphatase (HAD superfamily)
MSRTPLPDDGVLDDTEPWARRVLTARWRALGTAERVELVREHTAALERMSLLGLRARYPDADHEELRARAAATRFGRELFARLSGRTFTW